VRGIWILAAARRDLLAGFRFYESQAEGVGRYFLDTLYSDIESPQISAGVHAVYFIEQDEIRICAVLDSRRNPNLVRGRLAGIQER
jgi:hypothetical protein